MTGNAPHADQQYDWKLRVMKAGIDYLKAQAPSGPGAEAWPHQGANQTLEC